MAYFRRTGRTRSWAPRAMAPGHAQRTASVGPSAARLPHPVAYAPRGAHGQSSARPPCRAWPFEASVWGPPEPGKEEVPPLQRLVVCPERLRSGKAPAPIASPAYVLGPIHGQNSIPLGRRRRFRHDLGDLRVTSAHRAAASAVTGRRPGLGARPGVPTRFPGDQHTLGTGAHRDPALGAQLTGRGGCEMDWAAPGCAWDTQALGSWLPALEIEATHMDAACHAEMRHWWPSPAGPATDVHLPGQFSPGTGSPDAGPRHHPQATTPSSPAETWVPAVHPLKPLQQLRPGDPAPG